MPGSSHNLGRTGRACLGLKWVRGAGHLGIYAVPWMWYSAGLLAMPLACAITAVGMLIRWILFRGRIVPNKAAASYHAVVSLFFWIQAIVYLCMVDPFWLVPAAMIYWVLFFVGDKTLGRRAAIVSALAFAALGASNPLWRTTLAIMAVIFILEERSGRPFEGIAPRSLAIAGAGLLVLGRLYGFYLASYPFEGKPPLGVGCHLMEFRRTSWNPAKRYFAGESCDHDWMVFGYEDGLGALHRVTGEVVGFSGVEITTNNYAIDCDRNELFVGDVSSGRIYVYPASPPWSGRELRVFETGNMRLDRIFLDSPERRLLATDEWGSVALLDADTGKILESMVPHTGTAYAADGLNPYVLTGDSEVETYRWDGKDLRLVWSTRLPWDLLCPFWTMLTPAEVHVRIFRPLNLIALASMPIGQMYFVDARDGSILDSLTLEPGIRHMAVHPSLPVVLVVSFGRGNLFAVDVSRRTVVGKTYVGPRVRTIKISRDGRRAYVLSDRGIIEVDLAQALNIQVNAGNRDGDKPLT